jgi:hypothetical protein
VYWSMGQKFGGEILRNTMSPLVETTDTLRTLKCCQRELEKTLRFCWENDTPHETFYFTKNGFTGTEMRRHQGSSSGNRISDLSLSFFTKRNKLIDFCWRFINMLLSHLWTYFPIVSSLQVIEVKFFYKFTISCLHTTCPAHHVWSH